MEEERWIEGETEDNSTECAMKDLFADPDPYDVFVNTFMVPSTDESVVITLHGMKAENGQTLDSTGLTLWKASEAMCTYLVDNANIVKGKSVLELGAGLGLCGILCHCLGASRVILTDGDTNTLSQMRDNVNMNVSESKTCTNKSSNISCHQLLWGRNVKNFLDTFGQFDVITASDVIYLDEVVEPLLDTVVELLETSSGSDKGGTFLLGFVKRNVKMDYVLECAKKRGMCWTRPEGGSDDGVFVFRMA